MKIRKIIETIFTRTNSRSFKYQDSKNQREFKTSKNIESFENIFEKECQKYKDTKKED